MIQMGGAVREASFSRGSSRPRDRAWVSHIVGRRLTIWATRVITWWSHGWGIKTSTGTCEVGLPLKLREGSARPTTFSRWSGAGTPPGLGFWRPSGCCVSQRSSQGHRGAAGSTGRSGQNLVLPLVSMTLAKWFKSGLSFFTWQVGLIIVLKCWHCCEDNPQHLSRLSSTRSSKWGPSFWHCTVSVTFLKWVGGRLRKGGRAGGGSMVWIKLFICTPVQWQMAVVTEEHGFNFPFGSRRLVALPASSGSGQVIPAALGARDGGSPSACPLPARLHCN